MKKRAKTFHKVVQKHFIKVRKTFILSYLFKNKKKIIFLKIRFVNFKNIILKLKMLLLVEDKCKKTLL